MASLQFDLPVQGIADRRFQVVDVALLEEVVEQNRKLLGLAGRAFDGDSRGRVLEDKRDIITRDRGDSVRGAGGRAAGIAEGVDRQGQSQKVGRTSRAILLAHHNRLVHIAVIESVLLRHLVDVDRERQQRIAQGIGSAASSGAHEVGCPESHLAGAHPEYNLAIVEIGRRTGALAMLRAVAGNDLGVDDRANLAQALPVERIAHDGARGPVSCPAAIFAPKPCLCSLGL